MLATEVSLPSCPLRSRASRSKAPDVRPANFLLGLRSLDGLDESEVLDLIGGEPYQATIHMTTKDAPDAPINQKFEHLPKYLVYPVDWRDVKPSLILPKVRLTDFGQSFLTSSVPPPSEFGIPPDYRAPELAFELSSNIAMDLWSLGCTLVEIRTGQRLFNIFPGLTGADNRTYIEDLAAILGKPPDPWWSLWPRRADSVIEGTGQPTGSKVTFKGRARPTIWFQRARSIREYIVSCHDCSKHQQRLSSRSQPRMSKGCPETLHEIVPKDEAEVMVDLIEKLVTYKPEDRMAAQDVLDHGWLLL